MAYIRAWSDLIPAGSRRAGDVDDAIRELRVDIRERMAALIVDWTTDPVVPISGISGAANGLHLMVGPHILRSRDDEDDVNTQAAYVALPGGNAPMYGNIILPPGTVLTLFEVWMERNAVNVTAELFSNVLATGVSTSLTGTITRAAAGIGLETGPVINKTILNTEILSVKMVCDAVGGAKTYGFRLTYNRANSTQAY